MSNVIHMTDSGGKDARRLASRDRRYSIRYPLAVDAELLDLESGNRAEGITSDISMGGCFICTSQPLLLKARACLKLKRKDQIVEALVVVRIIKPRIGMGVEFIDLEAAHTEWLARWLEQLRRSR